MTLLESDFFAMHEDDFDEYLDFQEKKERDKERRSKKKQKSNDRNKFKEKDTKRINKVGKKQRNS